MLESITVKHTILHVILHLYDIYISVYLSFFFLCRKEFCELCLAKDRQTEKVFVCKKFLKKDGRKVRKAAKNEIMILKMYVLSRKVDRWNDYSKMQYRKHSAKERHKWI